MVLCSWRWFLALWLLSDWKTGPSRPNQKRLWICCNTCGHYNSSKAASSQCGLRRSWAEVVKGVQQTSSSTPPSQPKEGLKALEAALAALPDNVELFGKVRAPLEERLQHARKEARDSKPLDQRLGGCRGALQRASKAKQAAIAQQQAAPAAFEKVEADESRIRAELAELEKQALSQTTQPTCLQTISTQCCGDRTLSAHANDRSFYHSSRTRWSSLPHCSSSGESITCRGGGLRHLRLGLRRRRFGLRHTRRRSSRHRQTRLRRRCAGNASYGQTSHQSTMATTESTAG